MNDLEANAVTGAMVDYVQKTVELEAEVEQWRTQSKSLLEQLQTAQQELHALRARLTAVALVIRP